MIYEWTLERERGAERLLLHEIQQLMKPPHPFGERMEEIKSVVAEAYLNTVEHGNRWHPEARVHVKMFMSRRRICFRVYDFGQGFHYEATRYLGEGKWKSIDQLPLRGWGLQIMTKFADEVSTGFERGMFYVEVQFMNERWNLI